MNLPFTAEQFSQVFADYNEAVVVAPVVLMVPAILSVSAILRQRPDAPRIVAGTLAFLWVWSGLVYHLIFFARINPWALAFGGAFIAQGLWFVRAGRVAAVSEPGRRWRLRKTVGAVIVVYALVGYPIVSVILGHSWPAAPTFGAPCPVVIFTLGIWLWQGAPGPRRLLIIPLTWSALGSTAALKLGMYQDWGMLIAGLSTLVLIWNPSLHSLTDGKHSGSAAASRMPPALHHGS